MKVLVVRLSSFGDQIHVCPAVADLKRQRPDVEIHWLTQSEFAAVPQAHRSVSKVFTVPLTTLKKYPFRLSIWREFFRTVKKLRNERYSVAVDVHGVIKSALMVVLSGAKTRVGFGRQGVAEGLAYSAYHRHFRHTPGLTAVNKLRDFFRWTFDLEHLSSRVEFGLTVPDQGKKTFNKVLLVPCASHPSKMLPLDHWVDLAFAISAEDSTLAIWVSWGSEREREIALALQQITHGLIKPNPKRFEATELFESLRGYKFVVGLDSGISQLANALGVPTLMVFVASSPEYFFFPGSSNSSYLGSLDSTLASVELRAAFLKMIRNSPKTVCC